MSPDRVRVGDALTIEMLHGEIGVIRCLRDPTQSPGDVEWSCAFVIDDTKKCTIKILCGVRAPTGTEVKQLIEYFKINGCHGGWHRNKNGKDHKQIIIKCPEQKNN